MGDESKRPVETISFTLEGPPRDVDDETVAAFDAALERVGANVMHAMDPRRLLSFESGGPPVWSVAYAEIGSDRLYLTYGLSAALEAGRLDHELSLRVPAGSDAGMWPVLLLRMLARYVLSSGRELKKGDFFPLPSSITTAPVAPADRSGMPRTPMNAIALTVDPDLPFIETKKGRVEVRRVVGLHPDERELLEPWSAAGFVELLATRDPHLVTDIGRASKTTDREFVTAAERGSARDGSAFGFVAVEGVDWSFDGKRYVARFPGGAEARRIDRMVKARLLHGRHLLVHDFDPERTRAVAIEPSEALGLREEGDVLVIELPRDAPHLNAFSSAGAAPVEWALSIE